MELKRLLFAFSFLLTTTIAIGQINSDANFAIFAERQNSSVRECLEIWLVKFGPGF
jgi:hypothetical protein